MKNYIFPLVLFFALLSCSEENPQPVRQIAPALAPYVSMFYAEAAERGVTISQNLTAEFKYIQAISQIDEVKGRNYLYFNPVIFNGYKTGGYEALIEAHVFYRLGGLLLHNDISEEISFMNPNFMFEPYNPQNKEAMFDRLFKNP